MSNSRKELMQKKAQELEALSVQQNEIAKEVPSVKAQEHWSIYEKNITTAKDGFLKQKNGDLLLEWNKAVENANHYISDKLKKNYNGDVNNKKVKERRSFIQKQRDEIKLWQAGLLATEDFTLKVPPPSSTATPNNSPVATVRKTDKVIAVDQKLNDLRDSLHDNITKYTKVIDLGELAKAQSTPKMDPSYRKSLLAKKKKSCCCCPFWNKPKKSSTEKDEQELKIQYNSIQG